MNTEAKPSVTKSEPTMPELIQQVASLSAQVIALTAKPAKVEVTAAQVNAAIAQRDAQAKSDLEGGNPKANPVVGLTATVKEIEDGAGNLLTVIPAFTKEQRAEYHKWKAAVKRAYSAMHRTLLPQRKAILARTLNKPAAMVATVAKSRKDGTVSRVSISASEPAKVRKGKGLKKAKPAQIAAHVPAAGNAQVPAMVS